MVQVQSSWFPLYDRNPQTFVPNIFWAKAEDYRKAVQRIYHASFIELPLMKTLSQSRFPWRPQARSVTTLQRLCNRHPPRATSR